MSHRETRSHNLRNRHSACTLTHPDVLKEKAGMRLVRTFRMTPEEFAAHGIPYDPVLWDGDDVEYAIERAEWEAQEAATDAP